VLLWSAGVTRVTPVFKSSHWDCPAADCSFVEGPFTWAAVSQPLALHADYSVAGHTLSPGKFRNGTYGSQKNVRRFLERGEEPLHQGCLSKSYNLPVFGVVWTLVARG